MFRKIFAQDKSGWAGKDSVRCTKNFSKLIFAQILTLIFLLSGVVEAAVPGEGSCGDNVYWSLDSNGTMTISGRGDMRNYLVEEKSTEFQYWFYNTEWQELKPEIKRIVVAEGVTSVGSRSFADCLNLREVILADSVKSIGSHAFWGCKNLETVKLPAGLQKIGKDAFKDCDKLSNMSASNAYGQTVAASKNLNEHEYTRWAKPIKSFLYVDGANLVRVENIGGKIIAEKYSPDFKLISTQTVNGNFLDIWGGFFAGKDFNFVVTGQENKSESNGVEVLRVSKFDKNWNFINDARIFGANTQIPFVSSTVRFAESGGVLYIHTGHQMYVAPDGRNHQANMTISLDEAAMKVLVNDYAVSNIGTGYVSHSFNQFILIDANKNILTFDHGDAYPRAGVLMKYKNRATNGKFRGGVDNVELVKFAGVEGDNATGASIGGLAETNSSYVTVYNYDKIGGDPDDYFHVVKKRNLFVNFTSKKNFTRSTSSIEVSSPDSNFGAGTPILAPVNQSGGYVLWNAHKFNGEYFEPTGKIYYAHYDSNNLNAPILTDAELSDCQPILFNGKIIWYVTNNSAPVFYILDENGLRTVR